MARSDAFARLKDARRIVVRNITLYVVHGDVLGDEDELYVEAVIRGAGSDRGRDPYRSIYLELDAELRAAVQRRLIGEGSDPRSAPPSTAVREDET